MALTLLSNRHVLVLKAAALLAASCLLASCSDGDDNQRDQQKHKKVSKYELPSKTGHEWKQAYDFERLWLMEQFVESAAPGGGKELAEEMKACVDEAFKSEEMASQAIRDVTILCATAVIKTPGQR